MAQGHEHLPGPAPPFPYMILDDRLAAVEAVLLPKPNEDPLRRVPLNPAGGPHHPPESGR